MKMDKRFTQVLRDLFEELLDEENLETALAGSLELVGRTLESEVGVLWLLDKKTNRLVPMFQMGPIDLSNVSLEMTDSVESYVTRTGESVLTGSTAADERFSGSFLEEYGVSASSMLCVPLNAIDEVIGCMQLVNRKDAAPFTDDELTLCQRLAALIAMTVGEKGLEVNAGEKKEVLISLRGVTKEFPSGEGVVKVLKGIDLDIYRGEFLVVLGESGCGKSTMVNIIGGMDFLTDGTLTIGGQDFSHPTENELTKYRREYLGFVFQSYNLMPNLTAQENVQFIADLVPNAMSAAEAIDMVGLTERANNYPAALSGGQQQRVAIARSFVKRPQVIFADEPTAALDYQTSIEVLSVFENIMRHHNTTVVMITHNPEIAKMASRVVKLKNGRVASIKVNLTPAHATELVW